MKKRDSIHIQLTTEQTQQIEALLGRTPQAVELDLQELEQRIAPLSLNYSSIKWEYSA